VWADPGPDGGPPNNWASSCGGPAWTIDGPSGQYYLHNHLPEQPDLNWWNDDVVAAFDDILRFWSDRGVAGFRIDVCNLIVKDPELRDNPPATDDDDLDVQLLGQRTVYNGNRPEVHDVFRHWHHLTTSYEEAKVLVGETPVPVAELARYYGNGDELDLAFNFPFLQAPFEAPALQKVVADTERLLPAGAWPAWTGSNHDVSRMATRWGAGDPRRTRLALVMLLCLRGTPVLFQGDEIGLEDGVVEPPDLRDPLGVLYWPAYAGRDGARTPMPWQAGRGGGFTDPGTRPWLPMADPTGRNVEDQRADPESVLTLVRDLLALRRRTPELKTGTYRAVAAPDAVWAWRRGEAVTVVLNLSDEDAQPAVPPGRVLIGTDRGRDSEHVGDRVALGPWEGLVLAPTGTGAPSRP
jgi:alpha-glucosidase